MPRLKQFFLIFSKQQSDFFMVSDEKNKTVFAVGFSNFEQAEETRRVLSKNKATAEYKNVKQISREVFKEFQGLIRHEYGFALELSLDLSPKIINAHVNNDFESIKGDTFVSRPKHQVTQEEALQLALEDGIIVDFKEWPDGAYTYKLTEKGIKKIGQIQKHDRLTDSTLTQAMEDGEIEVIGVSEEEGLVYKFTGNRPKEI